MRKHADLGGFTLIELSIVLLVIGLVTGAILFGQELIRAAQIRLQVGQIEKLDTAVNVFKSKYSCLPGDCANASDLGFGVTTDNGNGDGNIGYTQRMDDLEMVNMWYHLSQAGLVSGKYDVYVGGIGGTYIPGVASLPLARPGMGISWHLGGGTVYSNITGGVWLVPKERWLTPLMEHARQAWFLTTTTAIETLMGVYVAMDVYAIDQKIDDGLPSEGNVVAANGFYQTGMRQMFTKSVVEDACIDDTGAYDIYNVTSTTPSFTSLCAVIIKARF